MARTKGSLAAAARSEAGTQAIMHHGISKQTRTPFTARQLRLLESAYRRSSHLKREEKHQLARKLNVADSKIQAWFTYRRNKHKKAVKPKCDAVSPLAIVVDAIEAAEAPDDAEDQDLSPHVDDAMNEPREETDEDDTSDKSYLPSQATEFITESSQETPPADSSALSSSSAFSPVGSWQPGLSQLGGSIEELFAALPQTTPVYSPMQPAHGADDIVEATGRAFIQRLQQLYAKNEKRFLRAQNEVDNIIFKHQSE